MIVSLLTDPFLRATLLRGALPDEDVFWEPGAVSEAVQRGFPRLLVHAPDQDHPLGTPEAVAGRELPTLAITEATLRAWDEKRRARGFAVRRIDDHGGRLRRVIQGTVGPLPWVEAVFRDLTRASGLGLPATLKGFGRRVLEFPSRYDDLHALARLTGLSRSALKSRFRRRDLPSPYTYLRWFRALAVAQLLDRGMTTEDVAHRVGLHSSGNLCRFVQEVSAMSPNEIRGSEGRARRLAIFTERCLGRRRVEGWESLGPVFLRDVG